MTMTQETAYLIDTLAGAAAKIGSTPASKKINELIVELLPPNDESIADALREDLTNTKSLLAAEKEKTEGVTYISKQHTVCASCNEDKHTPLRVDFMDGYVCLTCIDLELERLYALTIPPTPVPELPQDLDDGEQF